jgi:hypothetical protein
VFILNPPPSGVISNTVCVSANVLAQASKCSMPWAARTSSCRYFCYNYFYRCNSYDKLVGRPRCGNKYVAAQSLEFTVWDFTERLITDPQTALALYQEEKENQNNLIAEMEQRLAAIDELLDENEGELRRLQKMYQRGGCDDDYFAAKNNVSAMNRPHF